MYKILIVDDEYEIRQGLMNNFNWEDIGYQVIGLAENGAEALKLMGKEIPNVVLTDIKMPEIDGLQLAKEIRLLYPETRVILLSAFDDFRYAQEAIRHNVKCYLTKPVRDTELKDILVSIKEELQQSEELEIDNNLFLKDTKSSNVIKYDSILGSLLRGQVMHTERLEMIMKSMNFPLFDSYFRIVACDIKPSSGNTSGNSNYSRALDTSSNSNSSGVLDTSSIPDTSSNSSTSRTSSASRASRASSMPVQQFLYKNVKNYCEKANIPVVSFMEYYVMFLTSTKTISKPDAVSVLQPYKEYMTDLMEKEGIVYEHFIIGVGNLYNNIKYVSQSYGEAVYANKYKYFINDEKLIFYQDIHKLENSEHEEEENRIIDTLIDQVLLNNLNDITKISHELFRLIDRGGVISVNDIQIKFIEIIFEVLIKIKEKGMKLSTLNKKDINNSIREINNYSELKNWFKKKLISVSNEIKEENAGNSNWIVRKARDYVNSQYYNKITLEDMALSLYLNPAYFSTAFKKSTGKNFVDYLTEVRVEKSKELLLKSEYKIKEISQKVGYDDYAYFCRVFKKVEGITPLEFRTGMFKGK